MVFLDARDNPGRPAGFATEGSPLTAVYLDRFLPEWLEREPDNPFVAVFAVRKCGQDLAARAPRLRQAIQDSDLPEPTRVTLSQVLEVLFFERFRTLTAEEIWTMLQRLTPLEETRAYQSIFVKGEAKGEAEGVAKRLKRLLARRFGPLPPWAEERIATAQIAQLDAWIDGLLDAESLAALIGPENRC